MIHGSILSLSLGKIWMRMPLKNQGVLSDVYDGRYIQFSKLSYEKRPTYDMKMPASTLMPCKHVPVVAAVRLADVPERGLQIELAAEGAAVVARDDDGPQPELGHQAPARVVVVEVAAEAQELERHLVVARERRRADDGVVDGVVPRDRVVDVEEEAPGEVLACRGRASFWRFGAVQPGEVAEREGLGVAFTGVGVPRDRREGSDRRGVRLGAGGGAGRRRDAGGRSSAPRSEEAAGGEAERARA